ncbi:cytochrome b-c1 complex subunit 8 [Phymastichus coffea]|uniref:cytochrome b-c1 complex subunit 8 n=1 Tax=Phymastichus coffea TaxID=108790 RepID=UPI00273C8D0C|nr:cytochrome b-c1 complex subunit 8 [Phymastichus coffea]
MFCMHPNNARADFLSQNSCTVSAIRACVVWTCVRKKSGKMGLYFGNLAKIRGIVYFRLSPHEQKAWAGAFSHGFPNMIRRFRESVFKVVPPMLLTYMLVDWADKENERLSRKNPKDYENDK